MILYPAIDIRGGRCVRLIEGDFDRETTYDSDPSSAARRWVEAGAEWLHVVDLDGAVAGRPVKPLRRSAPQSTFRSNSAAGFAR
jgi:phosphoribosylformimino-5-aminoimidazole carboxamide ribotide isomerase